MGSVMFSVLIRLISCEEKNPHTDLDFFFFFFFLWWVPAPIICTIGYLLLANILAVSGWMASMFFSKYSFILPCFLKNSLTKFSGDGFGALHAESRRANIPFFLCSIISTKSLLSGTFIGFQSTDSLMYSSCSEAIML